ncbi:MAG: ABC transporter permease [Pseudomonadota bacterium]
MSDLYLTNPANLRRIDNGRCLLCSGDWTLDGIVQLDRHLNFFILPEDVALQIDCGQINTMDTAGAWLLHRILSTLEQQCNQVDINNLKPEHNALLELVEKRLPDIAPPDKPKAPVGFDAVGRVTWDQMLQMYGLLSFLGETFLATMHNILVPFRIRWHALFSNIYTAGFNALPIIGLMSFLIGVVLAYQGGSQLKQYGANILIVDLVGLTLLRELAPMLTAIMVAGRTGSSYTAQIGTMKITDEIDALRTMGISPFELLVVPKLLALIIVLPLLTVFSDIVSIFGSMFVASLTLGVSYTDFIDRFQTVIHVRHYMVGIAKAPVFAVIIALIGCFQGFRVGGGADSVGTQVTISVVQAIFLVIVADAIFSILFNWLGI